MWSVCGNGIYIKGRCHRGDSSCCWQQAPFVVIFRAGNIALRYFLLTFIFSREDDVKAYHSFWIQYVVSSIFILSATK